RHPAGGGHRTGRGVELDPVAVVELDHGTTRVLRRIAVRAAEPAADQTARPHPADHAGEHGSVGRVAGEHLRPARHRPAPTGQYGHSGTFRPIRLRTLPSPAVSSTLRATLRANQPSWAS